MKRPKRWVGPDQEMTIMNADGTVAAEILQNDIQKLNRALYKKNEELMERWATTVEKSKAASPWQRFKERLKELQATRDL
jgi:hypothetical protein